MKKIVAIGGLKDRNSLEHINKCIVYLSNVKNPNFLFIPTASSDDMNYILKIKNDFKQFNVNFKSLNLISQMYTNNEIKRLINEANIIYVGGGNTKMMMQIWKEHNVDLYLKDAYENGTVCCGLSAGAICWFKWGHSDSNSFNAKPGEKWDFISVNGLNLCPCAICVHYDERGRDGFDKMIDDLHDVKYGFAIENNNAIVVLDNEVYATTNDNKINVYLFEQQTNLKYKKSKLMRDENILI